jgi:hypothetical protein
MSEKGPGFSILRVDSYHQVQLGQAIGYPTLLKELSDVKMLLIPVC